MACSVCKDPKHNSKTCTNQKQAFDDNWKDCWDEFHDGLVECVKTVIEKKANPQPSQPSHHLWQFFLDRDENLSSWVDVIEKKVFYGLPCSPLEMAVWRHHVIKNCFWITLGKGHLNGKRAFRATATQAEIDAYEDLIRFSWDAVCVEVV